MRIGVLGGTFDPPHRGHLALAEAAVQELRLDTLILVPNQRNPFKQSNAIEANGKQRFEMVRRLIDGHPTLATTNVEITRGGASYMVDTLNELQLAMPGDYWLVLGGDALEHFMKWRSAEKILRTTRLAVAVRPGTDHDAIIDVQGDLVRPRLDLLEVSTPAISATQVRTAIANGHPVDEWLTDGVAKYIAEHNLYRRTD